LGVLSYPNGEFRTLTTDTNDYFHPSVSADGKVIAAEESQFIYELTVAPASKPDELQRVALMSHQPIYHWNWMPDGKLIVPQGDELRLVHPDGGETVLISGDKRIPDQALACGKYVVFRAIPRSGGASVNLWRMDTAATTQLTFGRNEQSPQCSPDGKWRAALGSASLDAGTGNQFRSARASCIAGPCPFTKIDSDRFSQGEQTYTVLARDWSDTATFLLEAEVVHPMVSQIVHESYPVIFGEGLNFTLPSTAEGVSIEAELDGQMIVFPLGPELFLSWASCNARVNPDQTKVYRCDLKPGYRFQ